MTLISFKEKSTSCPYCQNLHTEENYAFGADFPAVANNDSFGSPIRDNRLRLSMKAKA